MFSQVARPAAKLSPIAVSNGGSITFAKGSFNIRLGLFGNTLAALQPITKLIEPNPDLRSVWVNRYIKLKWNKRKVMGL